MDGSGPASTRLAVAAAMVVVLVGATMLVVGPAATPALGCSCAGMPERQLVDAADAVFVGTVADRRAPSPDEVVSTADPVVWTFVVSKVYKGRVLARQEVVSERIGASCGLELPDRSRAWLIFASANPGGAIEVDDDQYYAGLCMGTRPAAGGPPAGGLEAREPVAVTPSRRPHDTGTPGDALGGGRNAAPEALPGTPVAVAGAAGVAVIAVVSGAWAVRSRRGRGRSL